MNRQAILTAFLLATVCLVGSASAETFQQRRPKLFDRLDINDNGRLGKADTRLWRHFDRDNNPPGRVGGPGSNWENPPGRCGGPGTSPNRRFPDRDNNPPGRIGGKGTNWENPPGSRGGWGASPNRPGRRR